MALLLFFRNYDGLIKAGFFGEFPFNPAAAGGKKQGCQLLSAGRSVFAIEFAYMQGLLIVNDVLGQPVALAAPFPRLEGYPLPFAGLVNVRRGIGGACAQAARRNL